jgi:hypothetical protein
VDELREAVIPEVFVYRLKSMVAMRLLAEATVFILLLLLPVVILLLGKFAALSITLKILVVALALVAAVALPIYGQVVFQVKVTATELVAYSVVSRRSCQLSQIKGLKRRSNWGWIRFVVEYDGGELIFPIWINHHEKLVAAIRARLPAGSGVGNPFKTFSQDPVALFLQFGQAIVSLAFAAMVWFFAVWTHRGGHQSTADLALLYTFAVVVSAVLIWRSYVVALMPRVVEVKPDQLLIHTVFNKVALSWDALRSVSEPLPLLPEGFVIRTTKGSYLIGNGMDSADELESSLKANITKVRAAREQAPPDKKESC